MIKIYCLDFFYSALLYSSLLSNHEIVKQGATVRSNDEIRPMITDKALLQIISWLIRVRSCSHYSTYGIFRRVFPVFRVAWQQREERKSLQAVAAIYGKHSHSNPCTTCPPLRTTGNPIDKTTVPTVYETTVVRELSAVA
jgi:hypothetical protein